MDVDVAAALAALEAHRVEIGHRSISDLFVEDPDRFARLSLKFDDLLFDYSKHRITDVTLAHLLALARADREFGAFQQRLAANGELDVLKG